MIKAKPKGSAGWKDHEICFIGISLGNPNCDGAKLEAMVDWLCAQSNFKGCIIDLSDTLHRHNLMVEQGITEPEARDRAATLGSEWLDRNLKTLEKLKSKMSFNVVTWDTWLNDPVVAEYEKAFYAAFQKDKDFRQAVLDDVNRYHERHGRSLWADVGNLDLVKLAPSIRYLIEELAVHSRMYEAGPCASLYPGDQQGSFKMVREGLVEGVPVGLQNSYFVRMNIYDDAPAQKPRDPSGTDVRRAANDHFPGHLAGCKSGSCGNHATARSYLDILRNGAFATLAYG